MRIGIDIGGTFTDIVAADGDGRLYVMKLLSTPADFGQAAEEGVRRLLQDAIVPGAAVEEVIHGTTVASNAILSRRFPKTGLITTRGFRDVLEIGRLRTPRLYDLAWEKPPPIVPRFLRLEVDERIAADGSVRLPLDEGSVRAAIERLRAGAVVSVAVCLINAYANPRHEARVGELVREGGDWDVTLSHEILPEVREYERTSTAVVNACVAPVVRAYLAGFRGRLRSLGIEGPLHIMQSAGGVTDATTAARFPVRILESGPAAGVVAAADLGRRSGCPDLIAFDMGGTTAKAALVEEGRVPRAADFAVGAEISLSGRLMGGGGYPVRTPCVDLAEVGAGGGSVLRVDAGGALQVGPESAGADPGPVCYARGGSVPTLTDANLVLGYLNAEGLAGGALPLDAEAARRELERQVARPLGLSLHEAALGAHRIAVARMVRAVRAVTAERGRDPRRYALLAAGGSGPLHAVAMARALGVSRVFVPASPGLFSAFGLLVAPLQDDLVRSCLRPLEGIRREEMAAWFGELSAEAERRLPGATHERWADVRYAGQSHELQIAVPQPMEPGALRDAFEREHERTYGHRAETDPVEVVALRLRAVRERGAESANRESANRRGEGTSRREGDQTAGREGQPARRRESGTAGAGEGTRNAYFGEGRGWAETPVLRRAHLTAQWMNGPAIIEDYDATTLVPPGARCRVDEFGTVEIEAG